MSGAQAGPSRRFVLKIGLISEAVLLAVAVVWSYARGMELRLDFSPAAWLAGLVAAACLLSVNLLAYYLLTERRQGGEFYRFRKEVIEPLCRELTVADALLIGAASGIAEEFFFRGLLQTELVLWLGPAAGIITASVIFAYIHFISALKIYPRVFLAYVVCGIYFALLYHCSQNLLPPILAHFLNNVVIIVRLRRREGQDSLAST